MKAVCRTHPVTKLATHSKQDFLCLQTLLYLLRYLSSYRQVAIYNTKIISQPSYPSYAIFVPSELPLCSSLHI